MRASADQSTHRNKSVHSLSVNYVYSCIRLLYPHGWFTFYSPAISKDLSGILQQAHMTDSNPHSPPSALQPSATTQLLQLYYERFINKTATLVFQSNFFLNPEFSQASICRSKLLFVISNYVLAVR